MHWILESKDFYPYAVLSKWNRDYFLCIFPVEIHQNGEIYYYIRLNLGIDGRFLRKERDGGIFVSNVPSLCNVCPFCTD